MKVNGILDSWRATAGTAFVAAAGAGIGTLVGLPAALLTGSALAVCLAGLGGLRMDIHPRLRDLAFLVIGVGIGSTVTPETTAAMVRWPLAFVALGVLVVVMMVSCQALLQRGFGFDARTAVLAAAPGHLSFVMGLSLEGGVDALRVTVVQAVRLLAITLIVPLVARVLGVEITGNPLTGSVTLSPLIFGVLMAVSLLLGLVLIWLRLPAALLIGAMLVSGVSHGAGWVTGGIDPVLGTAAFVTIGALIGTRFSGLGMAALRAGLGAGLAVTALASGIAALVAVPVAYGLGLGQVTVLAAFAPGGFETMIALGAVLGANPGFVAAAHVARLMFLTGLIPLMLSRARRGSAV
ncbi:AbrB family transcriptional regulator [Aestuariivita sp.]|jgi:membrane AbrB-like protein|uniref:AbrB family transcriptional regulator n=1 Tax=Aestuariivita sp. TaxID=1872407 RepID=UPI00216CE84D|nr:AbrB family transcriptional regulator [Aestuariivita sp.]MCE8009292.1 AbrB family transcriptional regulator [Aestuariivita sp.]